MSKPSAEQLMALADGELDAATGREIEARIAADTELALQYQVYVETKLPIGQLFASRAQDEVPERLVALVRDYDHGELPQGSAPQRKVSIGFGIERLLGRIYAIVFSPQVAFGGVAAAFALGLALGVTLRNDPISPKSSAGGQLIGWHAADSSLGAALESTPSGAREDIGQAGNGTVAFKGILSFRSKAGGFCRQYRLEQSDGSAQLGVACRYDGVGWKDVIRVSGAAVGAIKPAFSVATQQVDQTIDKLIVGDVLDVKIEARMIADHWRAR